MSRLGEMLVAAGLLDADKLEQALRAQIVWGGRLGTNLVELGFIDLDELSRALGRLHRVPAALAHHFDKADPVLQRRILPELADKHSFVPLVELPDGKVAIACLDPLDDDARVEVAHELGIATANLVVSVAAEQRMRYQLERVYNIARAARYLRSRGTTIPPFPQFGDFGSEPDSEVEIPIEWDEPAPPPAAPARELNDTTRAQPDALAALIDRAIAAVPPPIAQPPEPSGRERRSYVKTLADDPVASKLGRIAIRKVTVGGTPVSGVPIAPATETAADAHGDDFATLAEAAKAIRRGAHRDRVAELCVGALERFVPACRAAILLVVRGDTATGWVQFARSGAPLPDVAVPVDHAGLVPRAIECALTARSRAGELGAIDRRLFVALAGDGDGDLAVVPIAIAGKVMCVIACATDPAATLAEVETIATSAGTAFARLMRDAGR